MERALFAGILVFFALYATAGIGVAASVLLAWTGAMCLYFSLVNFETALAVFAFMIPLEHGLTGWTGARWHTLSYLFIVMVVITVLRHGEWRMRSLAAPEKFLLAFVVWEACSIIWSHAGIATTAGLLLTEAVGLLVMMVYARFASSELSILRWLHCYLWGNLVYAVVVWRSMRPGQETIWSESKGREVDSIAGTGLDLSSNLFARTCMVGMVAALAVAQFDGHRTRRRIAWALAAGFGLSIALSFGRTSMLAGMAGLIMWGIFSPGLQSRMTRIVAGAVLSVGLFATAWIANPAMFETRYMQTTQSYGSGDYTTLSTGRSDIWKVAWDIFCDDPIQGVGLGSFTTVYSARTSDAPRDTHNMYLRILAETGIVGEGLFLAFMATLFLRAWRSGRWRPYALGWCVPFAIVIGGATSSRAKEFWFAFGVTSCVTAAALARPMNGPRLAGRPADARLQSRQRRNRPVA